MKDLHRIARMQALVTMLHSKHPEEWSVALGELSWDLITRTEPYEEGVKNPKFLAEIDFRKAVEALSEQLDALSRIESQQRLAYESAKLKRTQLIAQSERMLLFLKGL